MSLLRRLFGRPDDRLALVPLYEAVVARARDAGWYLQGGVPDTLDGRFDMVAAILALVLIRLEIDGEPGAVTSARLTELFVDDMDGQLREAGIGDVVVGKHVGRMMGALGGRLVAYRDGLNQRQDLGDALIRNLYRGAQPSADAVSFSVARLRRFFEALGTTSRDTIEAGRLPVLT